MIITRRVWIRGHLATVTGSIDWADPDVGIMNDTFIPEHIVFDDRPELSEYEELTDSELNDLDIAYWAAAEFDDYENTVMCSTHADGGY